MNRSQSSRSLTCVGTARRYAFPPSAANCTDRAVVVFSRSHNRLQSRYHFHCARNRFDLSSARRCALRCRVVSFIRSCIRALSVVYVTKHGGRYHVRCGCSGTTETHAYAFGSIDSKLEPCEKCTKGNASHRIASHCIALHLRFNRSSVL
jgi:hypothetical protein